MCDKYGQVYAITSKMTPANAVTIRQMLASVVSQIRVATPGMMDNFYKANKAVLDQFYAAYPSQLNAINILLKNL